MPKTNLGAPPWKWKITGMAEARDGRLETLIEINALINSQYRDIRILLSRIMESAERLIGSDASSLLLLDPETGRMYFEIALGDKGDAVKKYVLEKGEGIAGWVTQHNRSIVVNNPENDSRHLSTIGRDTGYRTRNLIAVPLRVKHEVIGVLEAINKSDGENFGDEDLRFLEVLADQASIAIQNAREYDRVETELARLRKKMARLPEMANRDFVWGTPATGEFLETTGKVAASDSPVLILGESGTGKELIAERVHKSSSRSDGPFLRVNCASIPVELVESELFGHVKGAFTDALRDKSGYFERADGGTLFLDEVGDLPASAQANLLRVLENGRYHPVGGEIESAADVRVVAATNLNLARQVDAGKFRGDLYYRLAVFTLEIPPLRERPEDIEELARYFLSKYAAEVPQAPEDFSLEALEALLSYRWPGNVRELQNAVVHAVTAGRGKKTIAPADLGLGAGAGTKPVYAGKILKEAMILFKKNYVWEVLRAHDGNQTAASKALGIQRTYLSRLIRELGIAGETASDRADIDREKT